MKPTFQNSRQSRPDGAVRPSTPQISDRTDWSFQISGPSLRGGTTNFHPGTRPTSLGPGFHNLIQQFVAEEGREARFEGTVFGIIVALAAWPIVTAVYVALGTV